ncbi:Sbal_3080 family lipoprotein [Acinetobacter johnsonii]|uniref:Sbal_3080 family lipoprotein n=1 Tax=Acinetobacter johnsonii TaxID=40214 RepID=UPI00191F6C65|nr:Sbal_3080 family lipoprotein [Acinetobacter johnsonii]QQV08827.1 hypothetical protein I6I49_15385 [Acinetobacter johnsonii]
MKKLLIAGVLGLGLVGCSSVSVKTIPVGTIKQAPQLCIEDNPKVTVPEFNTYLKDAFSRHEINTRLYDKGAVSAECRYKLNYVAYRSWDIAMYLSQIKLDLFEGDKQIAELNWKQGSGAINKWRSTEGKVFDAVDQLLGEAKNKGEAVK